MANEMTCSKGLPNVAVIKSMEINGKRDDMLPKAADTFLIR